VHAIPEPHEIVEKSNTSNWYIKKIAELIVLNLSETVTDTTLSGEEEEVKIAITFAVTEFLLIFLYYY